MKEEKMKQRDMALGFFAVCAIIVWMLGTWALGYVLYHFLTKYW